MKGSGAPVLSDNPVSMAVGHEGLVKLRVLTLLIDVKTGQCRAGYNPMIQEGDCYLIAEI